MHTKITSIIAVLATLILFGCSGNVPVDKIYGTYKAVYPFGTETIILQSSGDFIQTVAVAGQQEVTTSGKWKYDSNDNRVNFEGLLIVLDGFGQLRNGWNEAKSGISSLTIEKNWFRITMASAAPYPYLKQ
ncbi:hypothetical protein [Fundidesulfovibrio agrisoli]|uniref:hypothetical protein n=1 Tax=Fundidesulfovibrio agrisoli TaxID=2922717 RepID=UPI001FACC68C|nr:hypothetical protein [Fundidesulfovibrio agrisoli]